jgi:hypothetical protein
MPEAAGVYYCGDARIRTGDPFITREAWAS